MRTPEIWQVDQTGSYVHAGWRQPTGFDKNFQGYGRFLSDAKGQYYFRTIKARSESAAGRAPSTRRRPSGGG